MPPEQHQFNNPINNQMANQPSNQSLSPQKPKIFLWVLVGLLILSGVFGVWYFTFLYPQINSDQNEETASTKKIDEFAGWKIYTSEQYGFEIKYPSTLSAREIYSHNVIVCFENNENTIANELAVCIDDNTSALTPSPDSLVFKGGECSGLKGGTNLCSYIMYSKNKSLLKQIGDTFKFTN